MIRIKRLWGIRHLRYWWHGYRLAVWVDRCREVGIGIAANPADIQHLEEIRNGRA